MRKEEGERGKKQESEKKNKGGRERRGKYWEGDEEERVAKRGGERDFFRFKEINLAFYFSIYLYH